MAMIRSPLRYPGGKSRAIEKIFRYLPPSFNEFREPFVGGGTVFIHMRQALPDAKIWINDLNADLFCFWKCAQADVGKLASAISKVKAENTEGRALFEELRHADVERLSEFERAVRFFVLNRISFSGTVDSGGYSQAAFKSRFTDSAIERLLPLKEILAGIRITNLDYKAVIAEQGDDVCIFLDPPYLAATQSRLYGKNGNLHLAFDHHAFARVMSECRHHWLITYDDSPAIRQNFAFAKLYEWELQYGMNNYKQAKAAKGRELFITNYPIHQAPHQLKMTLATHA